MYDHYKTVNLSKVDSLQGLLCTSWKDKQSFILTYQRTCHYTISMNYDVICMDSVHYLLSGGRWECSVGNATDQRQATTFFYLISKSHRKWIHPRHLAFQGKGNITYHFFSLSTSVSLCYCLSPISSNNLITLLHTSDNVTFNLNDHISNYSNKS